MRLMHEGIPQFMNAKAYDLAAALALEATLAVPGAVDQLEFFQLKRVEALLAAGRNEEALSAAKGLYNVSGMGFTRDMLSLVARVLSAAYPEDGDIANRFLAEQVEGARASTQPYQPEVSTTELPMALSRVKVNPKPYERAIQRESGEDFGALTATGNLMLLSDKPREAMQVFEKAYAIAPDDRLAYATENLARAMKAVDGTIGRANAFVLSVRPKPRD
jgi:tetratricopeptide (TPR) repeat protein